jgi:hypothetical protein
MAGSLRPNLAESGEGAPLAQRRRRAHNPSVVPMAPPPVAKIPLVRKRRRRGKGARRLRRRWHALARRARRKFAAAPRAVRIALIGIAALILLAATNTVYHVARKPTELLYPVSTALGKMPAQTWRQYGPLFREYSTAAVTPELLATLAQVESAGNPLARTYWRWRLSWNPLAIYQPASSAVGTYQMTDAAFADARRHCIRDHEVVDDCWLNGLYTRLVPSHAVELTAVFLDRNVAAILAGRSKPPASRRQKEELATIVHLCGPGPARAFARRGFTLAPGERCGDHDVATYLARVNAMKREFLRLAAADG